MNNLEEGAAPQATPGQVPPPTAESASLRSGDGVWERIKRHKVVEWSLAYIAFGYALLHGSQMLRETLEWSEAVPRFTLFALLLGFPIAATLAWYHGHRAEHRVSRTEIAILVGLLLIAGSGLWWLARAGSGDRALVIQSLPSATPLGANSIAVLPFADLSEKKDEGYFSDGISEELIELLSHVPQLQVIAPASSFYFKGKQVTDADVARALGVAHILEGSVRKAGSRMRVTAHLVRADGGLDIWSQTFDRDLTDIFKMQDEIASSVVGSLKIRLLSAQLSDPYRSDDPAAYDQFLRGREFLRRENLEGGRSAIEAFRKATVLDSHYAVAYAALSIAESYVADYGSDAAGMKRALEAAQTAIALAPNLALAYRARAYVRMEALDFSGQRADLLKAISLAPDDGKILSDYGWMLGEFGRLQEATAALEKAAVLDPMSSDPWYNLGTLLVMNHDSAGARRAYQRCFAIAPERDVAYVDLGTLDLIEGRLNSALADYQATRDAAIGQMGIALVEHARHHDALSQEALQGLIDRYATTYAYQIAEVFAWRGETNRALDWLERALRQQDNGLSRVRTDPLMNSVQSEPRFHALLERLGLS